jgi:hypothetical protein
MIGVASIDFHCSQFSPLDQRLILTSNRAHNVHFIPIDLDVGHMFRMATETPWFVILTTWAPVDID